MLIGCADTKEREWQDFEADPTRTSRKGDGSEAVEDLVLSRTWIPQIFENGLQERCRLVVTVGVEKAGNQVFYRYAPNHLPFLFLMSKHSLCRVQYDCLTLIYPILVSCFNFH